MSNLRLYKTICSWLMLKFYSGQNSKMVVVPLKLTVIDFLKLLEIVHALISPAISPSLCMIDPIYLNRVTYGME